MKKVSECQSPRSIEVNNDLKAEAASSTRKNLCNVGFWAALLTSIIAAASLVIGFATLHGRDPSPNLGALSHIPTQTAPPSFPPIIYGCIQDFS
jgi:hypothetical protein